MFQRVTAVVVLCVLLGAACSSDSSPDPGVSTVETVTTQTLQSATKAELDVDIEGFIAEIPDEKVRASVENALDLAEEVAKPCATPAQWSVAADDAAEALSAAAAKIEASETLEEWRSAAVEVGMVNYFVKLMAVDPLCVGGQQSDRDTVWRSAVGVLGALDELQSVVSPGVSGRASSVFWLDSDVLGHTVEVQRLVSG
ncbi:MAG: hypothetical protein IH940_08580, partial [Acidobacteria bacterium]|nr:hypothetical protein [Acidobacteriota bacterium]